MIICLGVSGGREGAVGKIGLFVFCLDDSVGMVRGIVGIFVIVLRGKVFSWCEVSWGLGDRKGFFFC